jgi:hypothetical protein
MSTKKTGVTRPTRAPSLLAAPAQYQQLYIDQLNNAIRLYFNQVDNFSQSILVPNSGSTADRPVTSTQVPLPIGLFYFDTTLGYPIYWDGTQWVDATGTPV